MSTLGIVLLISAGTLIFRASLVALLADARIPDGVAQALRLVAPAVMAGLVAQSLFVEDGGLRLEPSWDIAALVAVVVAWRTRSMIWTLAIGMIALWLAEFIL